MFELPGVQEASVGWRSRWSVAERVGSKAQRDPWRRALNLLIAAALLVVSAPLMVVIAAAIRLSSAGPVLYSQPRVGIDRRNGGRPNGDGRRRVDHGGRVFRIYKFRTMLFDGSRRNRQVWARPDDPRITPVGHVLRKYRLDELPQLLNVLRGEMDLVGPRPEQPAIFARLREQVDGYVARQRVRPGITGWAQVNRSYDRNLEDVRRKLRFDLEYIARQSAFEDLKIILRTIPVVLLGRGSS